MANKDLFKQAIAEAKSVRSAAIANAKEALEETLTPHLKEMLAAKLQEMEDSSDEEVVKTEAHGKEDANQLEEELTFEEEETEDEEEANIDSEESEEEAEEEEVEVKDMEVDDLKDLIRDIIAQEMEDEPAEDELAADELPTDDMVGVEDEEEIDLDELLREISEMSDEDNKHEAYHSKDKKMEEDAYEGAEKVKEYGSGRATDRADSAASGLAELERLLKKLAAGAGPAAKKAYAILQDLGAGAGSAIRNEGDYKKDEQLSEAVKTVEKLSAQLQEVNLLNAKLLYVNKVMKANNLTESQKVNIIAAFDKAETVKEAKLVFETVSNNLVNKPSRKRSVTEAKLGSASRATGLTASKPEVITEVSDAVKRMQKLAGIIK
mgnify:CR=1 FL=1